MSITTEESTNEFARVPWNEQMNDLARVLRSRGRDIPPGTVVHLIPVPGHLRNENGKPLFRIAIVENEVCNETAMAQSGEGIANHD